jgi:uncharacterized protein YdbL (DUF1318 family)
MVHEEPDKPLPDRIRDKAVELAEAQASDADIKSALLMEFCRLGVHSAGDLPPSVLEGHVSKLVESRVLDHARTRGRVMLQRAMYDVAAAKDGNASTLAAHRLLSRVDAVEDLAKEQRKVRKQLQAASEAELTELIFELVQQLGNPQAIVERLRGGGS